MTNIGRNDPCPCGSGFKFKKCCLNADRKEMKNVVGISFDPVESKLFLFKDNMLINQMTKSSKEIEESFDNLCKKDIAELSKLLSQISGIVHVGIQAAIKASDEVRVTCAQLLVNGMTTFNGAVQSLRCGYVLAPGILSRSIVEILAVTAHLLVRPKDLELVNSGKFKSTIAITTAKQVIPIFGHIYGFLSEQFAHVGILYRSIQPLQRYKEVSQPLSVNLAYLRVCLWMTYVIAELVFYDSIATPRYWKKLGEGKFEYSPSDDERKWMSDFTGHALEKTT